MNVFVIAKREFLLFFVSPLTYFVGATFLFVIGLVFFLTVALHDLATLAQVFNVAAMALFFVAPLVTMHLLSMETHRGTLELLLTAPVRDWEVVVGKFLAALLLFVAMLIPTFTFLLLLVYYGKPDIPVILSGYLGLGLVGAMLISIGILASALSTNQVVAAVVAVALSLLFWIAGGIGTLIDGPLGDIFTYLSIQKHFTDFVLGLVTTSNIVYFLSATVGALFVTTRVLEVRRWR